MGGRSVRAGVPHAGVAPRHAEPRASRPPSCMGRYGPPQAIRAALAWRTREHAPSTPAPAGQTAAEPSEIGIFSGSVNNYHKVHGRRADGSRRRRRRPRGGDCVLTRVGVGAGRRGSSRGTLGGACRRARRRTSDIATCGAGRPQPARALELRRGEAGRPRPAPRSCCAVTTNTRGLSSELVLEPGEDPDPTRNAMNLDSVESASVAVPVERLGAQLLSGQCAVVPSLGRGGRLGQLRARDRGAAMWRIAGTCSCASTARMRPTGSSTLRVRHRCDVRPVLEMASALEHSPSSWTPDGIAQGEWRPDSGHRCLRLMLRAWGRCVSSLRVT